jgi:mono/diheme cytochrome c family protein
VLLQNTIFNAQAYDGQPAQPLPFSPFISFETMEDEGFGLASGPDGPDAGAPELTRSATWQALYDAYSNGRALAPPYHRERITDAVKLAAATEAYQAFLAGELEADELPDLSDVLPDDRQLLAEMSFAVEPDASDATLLAQGCAECHNATLDQSLSRARFDADLTRVTQAVIERALERLELPADDPLAMPPPGFRSMTAAQRSQLADYLRSVDRATLEPWPATGSAARSYALELGHHFQHEGSAPENLVIGDLTGDGRMDLLSPPYAFQQQPDGSLADRVEVPELPCCKAALVDVDDDGLVDLVTTGEGEPGSNDRGVLTLLSRGDLMLSPGIASPGPTLHALDTVRIGDVDLDGHLDLLSTGTLSTVNAYLGDGRGEFSATSIPVGDDPGAQFGPLALGDVTGDELDDLVLFDHHSSTLVIHASDGEGGFATTPAVYDVGRGVDPFASLGSRLAIGDADGDGLNDILMGPGSVSLLLQDSDGDFAPGPVLNISGGSFAFVDMDGDGRKDIVTIDGQLHVLLNGPLGFATTRALDFAIPSTSGSVLDTLAIGDLNDDGCPDVAVARNGSVIVMHGKGCL